MAPAERPFDVEIKRQIQHLECRLSFEPMCYLKSGAQRMGMIEGLDRLSPGRFEGQHQAHLVEVSM